MLTSIGFFVCFDAFYRQEKELDLPGDFHDRFHPRADSGMQDHDEMMLDDHAHMNDHASNEHGHAKSDDHERSVRLKDHGHVKDHPILDIEEEILHAQHLLDQEHHQ